MSNTRAHVFAMLTIFALAAIAYLIYAFRHSSGVVFLWLFITLMVAMSEYCCFLMWKAIA